MALPFLTTSSLSLLRTPNPSSKFPTFSLNKTFINLTPNFKLHSSPDKPGPKITDEWGDKSDPEVSSSPSVTDAGRDDDEWGEGGSGVEEVKVVKEELGGGDDEALEDLKRCLVDTFYGTELGFTASSEVRAEVLELVNQLESMNPTEKPVEATGLLDGKWVLLYTAFSELLPLLAAGTIPMVKVKEISQAINIASLTIDNSITVSSPLASFSFSAAATFEVQSPTRIQVQFKEGILKPPEISSTLSLPENIDILGQNIDLLPVQRSLVDPLQENVANLARVLSGQAPIKVPIPDKSNNSSWLIITYLDKDLRISRGDGGLFILAKEGSPLLN